MNSTSKLILFFCLASVAMTSCVTKKKFAASQSQLALSKKELDAANKDLARLAADLSNQMAKTTACQNDKSSLNDQLKACQTAQKLMSDQIEDLKIQRDNQNKQVGDLTNLSQSANNNIRETLSQLEKKDRYLHYLQAAKTKADSINLALAVNLKGVLKEGLDDTDVEVKVDKQVVFVNLSDKMLFQTGSSTLTPRAGDVLGKIAKIIESRPELEVMVEGYTDSQPIKTACLDDNWDLSVKRSTAVVRVLQNVYKVNPDKLIAAGRGQYNALAPNDTETNRAINRRTRIIILPKMDQFYDLLNPDKAPK